MGDETDERLVFRAKQGDVEAFTELVRSCQERVFRTILSFTRNVQDADDLMQETFLQAYRNLGEFKGRSSFFTWVYRIAVNRSLNFLKKKRQEKGRGTGRGLARNGFSSRGAPAQDERGHRRASFII
jgi:RNA polymerase sigma-70 factor (ECF subfamily)